MGSQAIPTVNIHFHFFFLSKHKKKTRLLMQVFTGIFMQLRPRFLTHMLLLPFCDNFGCFWITVNFYSICYLIQVKKTVDIKYIWDNCNYLYTKIKNKYECVYRYKGVYMYKCMYISIHSQCYEIFWIFEKDIVTCILEV